MEPFHTYIIHDSSEKGKYANTIFLLNFCGIFVTEAKYGKNIEKVVAKRYGNCTMCVL